MLPIYISVGLSLLGFAADRLKKKKDQDKTEYLIEQMKQVQEKLQETKQ